MISLLILSSPVAQPRQRHALIAGRVRNYTPAKHPVQQFKAECRKAAKQQYDGLPLEGPLTCSIEFVLPRRKSAPKLLTGRLPHDRKPDAENLVKSTLDALTGVMWHDDRQVFRLVATKWEAGIHEPPHVRVLIDTIQR